jgi:hypothetical protein
MELVEQRIKLPSTISEQVSRRGHLSEGWQAHRVNDVLPLGSIPNVHGIMSNWHHMYAAVDRGNIFCLFTQTSVRRDELYEQPVLGAESREMVAPPPGHNLPPNSDLVKSILCLKSLRYSNASNLHYSDSIPDVPPCTVSEDSLGVTRSWSPYP